MIRRIDHKTLNELYVVKGLSIKQICKELKASDHTISRELKRHGLLRKSHEHLITHGMSNSRQYKIWQQMKVRCDNPVSINYGRYGGAGITYDEKWSTFDGFWEDMKHGYSDDLTLDRICNEGNYTKDNCRWATYSQQNLNRKSKVGTQKTVKELSRITGLSESAIYKRIRKGWSDEQIISTPKLTNNGKEQ